MHKTIVAAAAAATLALTGSAAAAASGPISVFVAPTASGHSRALITGAVGDYGRATNTDRNGKVDAKGHYVKLSLAHGSFELDTTRLNTALKDAKAVVNGRTCSLFLSAAATLPLLAGTGRYAGIQGSVRLTATLAEVTRRTSSGACANPSTTRPAAAYQTFTGRGHISFVSGGY
jgi:hypothetical protein